MNLFKLLTRRLQWCPRALASCVVIATVLWLTLAPDPVGDMDVPLFPGIDKVVHACMFFGVAVTLWCDAGRRGAGWMPPGLWVGTLCAVASLLLGAGIEWLQEAMGMGRSFEWADMAADAGGCTAACVVMWWSGR